MQAWSRLESQAVCKTQATQLQRNQDGPDQGIPGTLETRSEPQWEMPKGMVTVLQLESRLE